MAWRRLGHAREVAITKVRTSKNAADVFIKSLTGPVITNLIREVKAVAEHISNERAKLPKRTNFEGGRGRTLPAAP